MGTKMNTQRPEGMDRRTETQGDGQRHTQPAETRVQNLVDPGGWRQDREGQQRETRGQTQDPQPSRHSEGPGSLGTASPGLARTPSLSCQQPSF